MNATRVDLLAAGQLMLCHTNMIAFIEKFMVDVCSFPFEFCSSTCANFQSEDFCSCERTFRNGVTNDTFLMAIQWL